MMQILRNLYRDIRGTTALEYGLILCLIVMAMVVGMTALGRQNTSQWNFVASQVSTAVQQATA